MAINFPNNPVHGNTYVYNMVTYQYVNPVLADEGYWRVALPATSGVATPAEIDAGVDDVKYLTPAGIEESKYSTGAIKQRVADLSNAFVGMESMFPPKAGSGVHPAWIEKSGGIFSRLTYPSLWAWANSHGLVVSESAWLGIKAASPNGSVSVFSSGDGAATFRVPDVGEQGGFSRALKGASVAPIGDIDGGFEDQLQNITGDTGIEVGHPSTLGGAFGSGGVIHSRYGVEGPISDDVTGTFDASRVARTGDETSPRGSYTRIYIYTGNIVEDLPTPTPGWLNQQGANTNKIADLEARIIALEALHP